MKLPDRRSRRWERRKGNTCTTATLVESWVIMSSDGSSTLPTSTKRKPPVRVVFFWYARKIELTAVVNEAPVALQSRGLSEPAGGPDRAVFGSEWGSSGAQELNPERARRRECSTLPVAKNIHILCGHLFCTSISSNFSQKYIEQTMNM